MSSEIDTIIPNQKPMHGALLTNWSRYEDRAREVWRGVAKHLQIA